MHEISSLNRFSRVVTCDYKSVDTVLGDIPAVDEDGCLAENVEVDDACTSELFKRRL